MKILRTIYAALMVIPILIWFVIVFFIWRYLLVRDSIEADIDTQSD